MPEILLTVQADLPDVALAALTRDLSSTLTSTGVEIREIRSEPAPGKRGVLASIGQLALDALSGGAVTEVIKCLEAYIRRERTLAITIKDPTGRELTIDAKNIGARDIQRSIEALLSARTER